MRQLKLRKIANNVGQDGYFIYEGDVVYGYHPRERLDERIKEYKPKGKRVVCHNCTINLINLMVQEGVECLCGRKIKGAWGEMNIQGEHFVLCKECVEKFVIQSWGV